MYVVIFTYLLYNLGIQSFYYKNDWKSLMNSKLICSDKEINSILIISKI